MDDRADAEAIAEAASRSTMRFVAMKNAETQGRASSHPGATRWRPDRRPFRTHQCLLRQRPQLINALREQRAELAPKGPASLKILEKRPSNQRKP